MFMVDGHFVISFLCNQWLNVPITVPSSWSISNQKTGCVKVIPIAAKYRIESDIKVGIGGWLIVSILRYTTQKHV